MNSRRALDGPEIPVSDETIADYLGGSLSSDDARAAELAILADDDASDRLYVAMSTEDAVRDLPEGSKPISIAASSGWWRSLRVVAPIALAAGLAVFFLKPNWGTDGTVETPAYRGVEEIAIVEPVGTIDTGPRSFRWNRVAGADHYRVEVYDHAGALIAKEEVDGTEFILPALFEAPSAGRWRVVPLDSARIEIRGEAAAAFTSR